MQCLTLCSVHNVHDDSDSNNAGGVPPSPKRDRLIHVNYGEFDDKSRCFCTRQLLHQLARVLPHSTGVLIPVECGRTPVLTGSLVQLGGTVVP